VHAAAGGVGSFAVQLAKAAKTFVIGTCSAPNKEYVLELGADEIIDYRTDDVFQRAKAIAGDRGIDAVVDCIGPSNRVDNLGLLGPEGGLACIAGIPDLPVVPDLPYSISIHDIGLGGVLAAPAFRRRQEDLGRMATELMTLVQEGKIKPTVTEQITLESIPQDRATLGLFYPILVGAAKVLAPAPSVTTPTLLVHSDGCALPDNAKAVHARLAGKKQRTAGLRSMKMRRPSAVPGKRMMLGNSREDRRGPRRRLVRGDVMSPDARASPCWRSWRRLFNAVYTLKPLPDRLT
jgi:hypothetical protein